jgi:hypothetical protein
MAAQLAQAHLGDHPPAANVRMLPASHSLPASGHQIEDQDHQCYNEQQVDQSAADVQTEPKQPQNQKNYHYRPKHMRPLSASWAPET